MHSAFVEKHQAEEPAQIARRLLAVAPDEGNEVIVAGRCDTLPAGAHVSHRHHSEVPFFLVRNSLSATTPKVTRVSGITKYSITALNLGRASWWDAAKIR